MELDVAPGQVRVAQGAVALGEDDLVCVGPIGDEARPTPWHGCIQFLEEGAARPHLGDDAQRHGIGGIRPAVGGADRHEGVDPLVPAEASDVVAGDQATEAVPDDVDALIAGLGDDRLHLGAQVECGAAQISGQGGPVHREDRAEAAPGQPAPQEREDRPVVDQPVHQQDRCPRRFQMVQEQAPLDRWQVLDPVVRAVRTPAAEVAERIGEQMGRHPCGLDGRAEDDLRSGDEARQVADRAAQTPAT